VHIEFVDVRSGETILSESSWEFPPPNSGDVLELHTGQTERWVVEDLEWVFADAPSGTKNDVPVRVLRVIVIREGEVVRDEHGDVKHHDPVCICGHTKGMHAPSRCLGDASTCQCTGFVPR
jgi:hypothetical protein